MSDTLRVVHSPSGRVLGDRVRLASTFFRRLCGLIGRRSLASGEGLLLAPCRAVHTFGMGFPLDVAFLRPDGRVAAVYAALPPRQRTSWHADAATALELSSGTLAGVNPGDRLEVSTATHPVEVPV